jgi:hypothetical protein
MYGQLASLPEEEEIGKKTGDTELTLGASNVILLLNTNTLECRSNEGDVPLTKRNCLGTARDKWNYRSLWHN